MSTKSPIPWTNLRQNATSSLKMVLFKDDHRQKCEFVLKIARFQGRTSQMVRAPPAECTISAGYRTCGQGRLDQRAAQPSRLLPGASKQLARYDCVMCWLSMLYDFWLCQEPSPDDRLGTPWFYNVLIVSTMRPRGVPTPDVPRCQPSCVPCPQTQHVEHQSFADYAFGIQAERIMCKLLIVSEMQDEGLLSCVCLQVRECALRFCLSPKLSIFDILNKQKAWQHSERYRKIGRLVL